MGSFSATDSRMAIRWLLRIAHNRIVDLVRMQVTTKRGGGRQTPLSAGDGAGDEDIIRLLQELAVHTHTPSRSAISHEMVAALEQSLDHLPEEYRDVIRYRYIDCLPFDEAARKMNRSGNAVQKLCKRGLDALRVELRSFSRYL